MQGRSGVSGTSEGHGQFWSVLASLHKTSDPLVVMQQHSISRATFYRLLTVFRSFGVDVGRDQRGRLVVHNWPEIASDVAFLADLERTKRLPGARSSRQPHVRPIATLAAPRAI